MKKSLKYLFLGLVGAMMSVYLICDIFSIWDSRPLKFAVSALITLFGLSLLKNKESRFVSVGLMFTLTADVFLVLLDKYLIGVAVFIMAQLCYAAYLSRKNKCYTQRVQPESNTLLRFLLLKMQKTLKKWCKEEKSVI